VALVLVDTSIWLEAHRGRLNVASFVALDEIAICPAIAQELLQGALRPDQYERVWDTILGSAILDDPTPLDVFEHAAEIYRRCRADGYLIASSHDCLIAATAIRHHVPLLQRDNDFEKIAEIAPLTLLPNV
jgi:predicted nucleic acid-binding protein